MTIQPKKPSYLIDWNEGKIYPSEAESFALENTEVTITFCGDWGPIAEHELALRLDPKGFYGDLPHYIDDSNVVIVNVEFPVCTDGKSIIKDGPTLCVAPDLLMSLKHLSCNVACLANNHIMDFGEQGLRSTLQALNRLGVEAIGAGMNSEEATRPLTCEISGVKLALINIAEGEEAKATQTDAGVAPLNVEYTCKLISSISDSVDMILVVIHAGREYIPIPPPYIQSAYRALADAGASLIVAHHPHVPQGIEIWNGVPIFYSQGNFVLFDMMETAKFRKLGYLIQVKMSRSVIKMISIIPYEIEANRIRILTGNARGEFLHDISSVSSFLRPDLLVNLWDSYADLWFETRFSAEIRQILPLISWQSLCIAFSDRLRLQQEKQRNWIARFFFRVLATVFQWLSTCLSNNNNPVVKSAAIFRNRLDTLAHRELYQTVLRRIIDGNIGNSPTWARELLNSWRVFD